MYRDVLAAVFFGVGKDTLITNLMLYWISATGHSAARLYYEATKSGRLGPQGGRVEVPTGAAIFPKEIIPCSRRWAEKRFLDIRYWNEPPRGGHFPAFEQPEIFVEELRTFYRLVR